MKQFNGDIFNGEWNGMVHCANLHCVMGGGIARVISDLFPEAVAADNATLVIGSSKLGGYSRATVERDKWTKPRSIFNLYGQVGIGNDRHPLNRNARYDAIFDGLWGICDAITTKSTKPYVLAVPHSMASDRAGGDWNIVEAIIKSVESHFPSIEFHIYKL